jgi:hypothetical protein
MTTPLEALKRLLDSCPEAQGRLRPGDRDVLYMEPWIPLQHLAQALIDGEMAGGDCLKRVLIEVEALLGEDSEELRKFIGFSFLHDLATAAREDGVEDRVVAYLGARAKKWWP